MKLQITGNLRSVANSAWVSTLDESKAGAKSDEEVIRVTKFLVQEHHTTPFESVTLTFSFKADSESEEESYAHWEMAAFCDSPYVRYLTEEDGTTHLTVDLFNFIKIVKSVYQKDTHKDTEFWKIFEAQDPLLASVVDGFSPPPEYDGGVEDVSDTLGPNGMTVELVELHEAPVREHMRATWRICCPLSIATQILRHRSGSFNATSGRYRTLNQDMVDTYSDITKIMEKIAPRNFLLELNMGSDRHSVDDDLDSLADYDYHQEFEDLLKKSSVANRTYDRQMQLSKKAKAEGKITNEEYKRFREFARYILPEGRMTELYCTFYLPDFIHYLQLRDSSHAQTEHVYVAQQMKKSLNSKLKDNFKIK